MFIPEQACENVGGHVAMRTVSESLCWPLQAGWCVTGDEVLLKAELHGSPVDGGRNKQQAGLGAEDGERWRKTLAHAAFWTRLRPARRRQQQQREPQPLHRHGNYKTTGYTEPIRMENNVCEERCSPLLMFATV